MSKKNRTQRLLINVTAEIQEGVRLLASLSGTTINEVVNRILEKEIAANSSAISNLCAAQEQYRAQFQTSLFDDTDSDKKSDSE